MSYMRKFGPIIILMAAILSFLIGCYQYKLAVDRCHQQASLILHRDYNFSEELNERLINEACSK